MAVNNIKPLGISESLWEELSHPESREELFDCYQLLRDHYRNCVSVPETLFRNSTKEEYCKELIERIRVIEGKLRIQAAHIFLSLQ